MTVLESLPAEAHALGGLPVRRILPARTRQMIGPFIFMDQGGPLEISAARATGVPEHPHAGLSTFTYLMAGALRHRDSAGYAATIRPGDIALMTSGRGITHEELPDPDVRSDTHRVYFAQLWLALPDALEECAPTFEHHRSDDLPSWETEGGTVRVAMGSGWGRRAPTTCYAPTLFADARVNAGGVVPLDVSDEEVAVMIIEGDGELNGRPLERPALHVLDPAAFANGQRPRLESTSGCRALVLGGARFPSPRFVGGSFVASSEEKLLRWLHDSTTAEWPRIEDHQEARSEWNR